jgi:hypothetical protein
VVRDDEIKEGGEVILASSLMTIDWEILKISVRCALQFALVIHFLI